MALASEMNTVVKPSSKRRSRINTANDHTQAVTPEGMPGLIGHRGTAGWKTPSLVTVNQWVQPVTGSNRISALTTTCAQGATGGGSGGAAAGMAEAGSAGVGGLMRRRRRRPPRCPGRRRRAGEEGPGAVTSVRGAAAANELGVFLRVDWFGAAAPGVEARRRRRRRRPERFFFAVPVAARIAAAVVISTPAAAAGASACPDSTPGRAESTASTSTAVMSGPVGVATRFHTFITKGPNECHSLGPCVLHAPPIVVSPTLERRSSRRD